MSKESKGPVLPEFTPMDPNPVIAPDWLNRLTQQLAIARKETLQQIEEVQKNPARTWHLQQLKETSAALIAIEQKELVAALECLASGQGKITNRHIKNLIKSALLEDTAFSLSHMVRYLKTVDDGNRLLNYNAFYQWLESHPGQFADLRQLGLLFDANDMPQHHIASWMLYNRWGDVFELPTVEGLTVWPYFSQKAEFLNQAFGLLDNEQLNALQFNVGQAMLVLGQFEQMPEQWLSELYLWALKNDKTYGPLARQVLTGYGVETERLSMFLQSGKQDERIVVAKWLAELGRTDAIDPLQKALKKEKRELAKAAILSALQQLGHDISEYLSEPALLKEAQAGLKKAMPKSLVWFPFDSLPTLTWQNGQTVDSLIIKWWVVLACKLKQPEGNPLLDWYIAQLAKPDQGKLGLSILQIFIEQNTANPTEEQSLEYAKANHQAYYDEWRRYYESDWTLEGAYRSCYRQHRSQYLYSTIADKGILALSAQASGTEAVELLNDFIKYHYLRHHHLSAMISGVSGSDDPAVIQLILSISRRYRTTTVMETARTMIERIAGRNGWSRDELADRTLSTGGLGKDGTLILPFGSRDLTVSLDEKLKAVLHNENGKLLKALPEPRKNDDDELVSQAKKDFKACKKEVRQVITSQDKRLYESMCGQRNWCFADWRQYLLEHPLMSRMIQGLVWQITQGNDVYLIRPTAELELIDLDDEEHTPPDDASIKVAHASQMSPADIKAWQAHFKAEKVKPLFNQFEQPKHSLSSAQKQGKKLDYHLGWLTTTFNFRNLMKKRGYQRGQAGDGGFFTHYAKDFVGLGIKAVIEFSGNRLPEENIDAALFHLCFVKTGRNGWLSSGDYLPLSDIPPVLVSEVMCDYEAMANKAKFDQDWQSKTPW